ncbi:hypothetical protein [uncultured Tateyamaria sp.]|uniref:hypothetical protein n=1 Tax=uncultured Tateyamaria sp. TaxID=455651 RepID=UPI00262913AF|nr:hypothetical protein [uncultured Tateyamaria sp.]
MLAATLTLLFSLLFIAAVLLYYTKPRDNANIAQRSRDFFETTPATQLVRRLDHLVATDDKLFVTSAEGAYPEKEPGGALWLDKLEEWMLRDVRITYLIVGGCHGQFQKLAELAKKSDGNLEIRVVSSTDFDRDRALAIRDLYTTHPTLLVSPDDAPKAMWLERYHAPESAMALGVSYIAPNDIDQSEIASIYIERVFGLLKATRKLTDLELSELAHSKLAA